MRRALVILPGVTADRRKRSFVRAYCRSHGRRDVFVPALWQRLGLRASAHRLRRFLRRTVDRAGYDRVDFLCYISGGFVLRAAFAHRPFPYRGRIVFVRSPLQEQVPARLVERRGRLLTALVAGRMVVDLAGPAAARVPPLQTPEDQGIVLERGLSRLARRLGLAAADFDALRSRGDWAPAGCREVWLAAESHDEAYTSPAMLDRVLAFLAHGTFAGP
jgi:hypothetical protein